MTDKVRVILADDHPITREGIKKFLTNYEDIELICEAEDGKEALRLVDELHPDVLILDMEMPEMKGLEVALHLKERQPEVKILALSTYDSKQYIFGSLAAGASGYLTKEEIPENIIEAIRGVARGEQGWVSRRVAAVMSSWAQAGHKNHELTERELQVLRQIVEGKTNQEISYQLGISQKTVEKHLEAVFTKLNVSSRVEAAVLAVRMKLFDHLS
jgi:DNA-binding NarL/FixJ family response regulator